MNARVRDGALESPSQSCIKLPSQLGRGWRLALEERDTVAKCQIRIGNCTEDASDEAEVAGKEVDIAQHLCPQDVVRNAHVDGVAQLLERL